MRALLVLLALLAVVSAAGAAPRFLLSSTQEETDLGISQGGSASTTLVFSNPGDVPLYVLLTPARVEPGWNLSVEPPRRPLPGDGLVAEANLRLEPGQRARATLLFRAPGPLPVPGLPAPATLQVDAVAFHLGPDGKTLASLARAFSYNISIAPGTAREMKNETIVAGLSDYPIRFGLIVPGSTGNATPGAGFPVRVWATNDTTVPVTLSLRGTDFSAGEFSFSAGQMSVSSDESGSDRTPLSTAFQSLFPGWASLKPGAAKEVYFWLQIPKRQPPGSYANLVTVALSREGLLPISAEPPAVEVRPTPAPSPTPLPATPAPKPTPGMEAVAAMAALAIGNVLYWRWRRE